MQIIKKEENILKINILSYDEILSIFKDDYGINQSQLSLSIDYNVHTLANFKNSGRMPKRVLMLLTLMLEQLKNQERIEKIEESLK